MWKQYLAYLRDNPEGYWFKRRLYGWGWVPVTWQGWTILLVYVLALVAFAFTIDDASPPREIMFTFILPVVLLTISLIVICYRTGEEPRWQWGIPDKYKEK